MDQVKNIEILWQQPARFELPIPSGPGCKYALEFGEWVLGIISGVDRDDRIELNQAILKLTKQYANWYNLVPPEHRYRAGPRGHKCIFHVFMAGLDQLLAHELRIGPPVYVPPPPPPRIERVEVPVPMISSFSDQGSLLGLSFGSRNEMD